MRSKIFSTGKKTWKSEKLIKFPRRLASAPRKQKKNKLSYRFFDPLPAENNNKKQNFACGGASRHHRHLVSVCVIINHQCAIVSLERVQNRAVLVWVPPLFKVQCCQRSRRCQHGTLSHHRTSWWNPRMVVRHPSKPCFGASKKKH